MMAGGTVGSDPNNINPEIPVFRYTITIRSPFFTLKFLSLIVSKKKRAHLNHVGCETGTLIFIGKFTVLCLTRAKSHLSR